MQDRTSLPPEATTAHVPDFGAPIHAWSDGGCRPNPGFGAHAAIVVLPSGKEVTFEGTEKDSTNNRMELKAALSILQGAKHARHIIIHTDSEYLFLGITQRVEKWRTKGWINSAKEPVVNRDLWEAILAEAARHRVEWVLTRGHADDAMNNRADAAVQRLLRAASAPKKGAK
ncbi:ribonuclease H family protein [Roseomonas gilardii]|uniref:ribonuclease H family protein n=1 Tax=Roseomonas gilardii TaxID=257708 RepID=UPI0009F8B880|nr:ribonuclease H [Roseomonas gilardii]